MPIPSGLLDQLQPHDGVVIEKLPRMAAIGADPPHHGGQVYHQIRACLVQELDNRGLVPQVEVAAAGHDDGSAALRLQLPHHMGPQEAGPPGHQHGAVRPKSHLCPSIQPPAGDPNRSRGRWRLTSASSCDILTAYHTLSPRSLPSLPGQKNLRDTTFPSP